MSERMKITEVIGDRCSCGNCGRSNYESEYNADGTVAKIFSVKIGMMVNRLCEDCLKKLANNAAQILSSNKQVELRYQVIVYHSVEGGFDEKLEYRTKEEAEKVALEYVYPASENSTFRYEGAAVYDLQTGVYICIYGDYPDENAHAQVKAALERHAPRRIMAQACPPGNDVFYKYQVDGFEFWFTQCQKTGNIYMVYACAVDKTMEDFDLFIISNEGPRAGCYPNEFYLRARSSQMSTEAAIEHADNLKKAADTLSKIEKFFNTSCHHDLYVEKRNKK